MAPVNTEYYDVLGVPHEVSDAELKKAYRKAALKWHPDKNPDDKEHAQKMFQTVAEAYGVLGDPHKKAYYDLHGKGGLEGVSGDDEMVNPLDGFSLSNPHLLEHTVLFVFNKVSPLHGEGVKQFFRDWQTNSFVKTDPFATFDEEFGPIPGKKKEEENPIAAFFGWGQDDKKDPFADLPKNDGKGPSWNKPGSSTKSKTQYINGKKITVTEKTIRNADGTTETVCSEVTA
jgi:DnaJ-class molecular chaperone